MPLVSVIVPAYNAEGSLAETLTSALDQTHRDLEVIIVNDGSSDRTGDIAEDFRAKDRRVRVIHVANGGVARARNHGIDAASGDFIAPLDADDLWHASKIERQLARFAESPPECGLVYNWFRRIGPTGLVAPGAASPRVEGWVPHLHLAWNFISNGSTPLIRRGALETVRYDPALHDAGNQGCEDYLLQLEVALRHTFALAPAFLTGYRRGPGGMSTGAGRMIRSHLQVFQLIGSKLGPSAARIAARRTADLCIQYARNQARRGRLVEAVRAATKAVSLDPAASAHSVLRQCTLALEMAAKVDDPAEWRGRFLDLDIEASDGRWRPERWHLAPWIRELDEAYGRSAHAGEARDVS